MKFFWLVIKSARRSKRRTILTVLSVAIAVFLAAGQWKLRKALLIDISKIGTSSFRNIQNGLATQYGARSECQASSRKPTIARIRDIGRGASLCQPY